MWNTLLGGCLVRHLLNQKCNWSASNLPFEGSPRTLGPEYLLKIYRQPFLAKCAIHSTAGAELTSTPLYSWDPKSCVEKNPAVQGMGPNTIEGGGPTLCHVLVYSCTHETPNLVRKNLQSTRDETYYKSRRGSNPICSSLFGSTAHNGTFTVRDTLPTGILMAL